MQRPSTTFSAILVAFLVLIIHLFILPAECTDLAKRDWVSSIFCLFIFKTSGCLELMGNFAAGRTKEALMIQCGMFHIFAIVTATVKPRLGSFVTLTSACVPSSNHFPPPAH